jgi:hypothetical protein
MEADLVRSLRRSAGCEGRERYLKSGSVVGFCITNCGIISMNPSQKSKSPLGWRQPRQR